MVVLCGYLKFSYFIFACISRSDLVHCHMSKYIKTIIFLLKKFFVLHNLLNQHTFLYTLFHSHNIFVYYFSDSLALIYISLHSHYTSNADIHLCILNMHLLLKSHSNKSQTFNSFKQFQFSMHNQI